jgi:hypothetical protein
MVWTTNRPIEPGYYWLKYRGEECIVRVVRAGRKQELEHLVVQYFNDLSTYPLIPFGGGDMWAGPIQVPGIQV